MPKFGPVTVRILACRNVTVEGLDGLPRTVLPGETVGLPRARAKKLIRQGHAEKVSRA